MSDSSDRGDDETNLDEGDLPQSGDFLRRLRGEDVGSPGRQEEDMEADLRQVSKVASQGTLEGQYFFQLKKNRELSVRLEVERAKVLKLQKRMAEIERDRMEKEQYASQGVLLPSQKGPLGPPPSDVEKELCQTREQLARQQKLVLSLRTQNAELKKDLLKMKGILLTEVGEENLPKALEGNMTSRDEMDSPKSTVETASKVAASSAGWRGRAQQISLLKAKVKELERWRENTVVANPEAGTGDGGASDLPPGWNIDTATTATAEQRPPQSVATRRTVRTLGGSTTARDFDDVNRSAIEQREMNRKMEVRDLQTALKNKEEELEKEHKRAESLTARIQILERDSQHQKVCLARVMEKTQNDDKLIKKLREELETKVRSAGAGGEGSIQARGREEEKVKKKLERQEATISELRLELVRLKKEKSTPLAMFDEHMARSAEPGSALAQAQSVIDLQRDAILSLEAQLERRDAETSAAYKDKDVSSQIREENASLKGRLKILTDVMQKEIHLYKSLNVHRTALPPAPGDASDKQVAHGRRRNTPTMGTREGVPPRPPSRDSDEGTPQQATPQHAAPPAQPDPAVQEELEKLKRQYSELRRAYNAQQLSKNRTQRE